MSSEPQSQSEILARGPIVASSGTFLIAYEDQSLVLYAAASLPDHWIRQGRRRPLMPRAALDGVLDEAVEWLSEGDFRERRNYDTAVTWLRAGASV